MKKKEKQRVAEGAKSFVRWRIGAERLHKTSKHMCVLLRV